MEQMRYRVEKVKEKKGYWVVLYHSNGRAPGHEQAMLEIDKWVRDLNLGKRMAFNMWKLKSEKARNWFILKWS